MKSPPTTRTLPPAPLIALLALVAVPAVTLQSCDASDPAPPTSGAANTLDPSALPAIAAERIAATELAFTPHNGADPGPDFRIRVPFQRVIHTAVMPGGGGVVVVREDDTAGPSVMVTRIGPSADTVFSRTYAYTPAPVTDDLFRRALGETEVGEALVLFSEEDPTLDGSDFEEPVRRSGVLPETLPAITRLAVGQDESIWLRREEQEGEYAQWTVLDAAGEAVGVVTLPRRQEVVAARGAVMVAVEEDELGRAWLVRYRVG